MTDELTPDSLRVGSLVGPWRVEGYTGRGSYGVVFRARRAGHPASPPVALKLALIPYDPRFVREAELLSRVHHPSVPQLFDRGWWTSDAGVVHPYLVMEWIRGVPMYEWARTYNPTAREVLQVTAQLAWALEVLHRADGLHRDVRGDNILVEPEGRAVLVDFGSGTWKGAPPITESLMPPNTREYRSPEALIFQWEHLRQRGTRYEAQPADDLYALGVSVYRLVTGVYPPPGADPEAKKDPLRGPLPSRLLPQALNGRVGLELARVIERLMAEGPEARGRALEVAEAAESAAEHVGPKADVPLFDPEPQEVEAEAIPVRVASVSGSEPPAVGVAEVPVRAHAKTAEHSWDGRRVLLTTSLILTVVYLWWIAPSSREAAPEVAQAEEPDTGVAPPEAGTTGLGDGGVAARVATQEPPISGEVIALEMPKQPLPGQRRAPCRGRGEVEIIGGCWAPWTTLTPPCGDEAYEWNRACFWPLYERTRVPTSDKPQ
ncbi:serine/threonine-protein kinase [Hyalangium sp.]|uniref:serine/threonine-protein kinase n=1 Tax=Hyalangium sp. TaxID=2028555 RepID=UPI002D259D87|nr:serine/threonine-protein kinase [Hyalangium sp.]HYI01495.1 serine/threonine-protein kinase [Hyalangium sp.]